MLFRSGNSLKIIDPFHATSQNKQLKKTIGANGNAGIRLLTKEDATCQVGKFLNF
jgi:hypothetical protein